MNVHGVGTCYIVGFHRHILEDSAGKGQAAQLDSACRVALMRLGKFF